MSFKKLFPKLINSRSALFLILLFAGFLRFYKINWSNDYFPHPDEDNMARSLAQLSFNDLNPHFFAYGQFPPYLAFFIFQLLRFLIIGQSSSHLTFPQAIISLRLESAFFSLATVVFGYFLSRRLNLRPYFLFPLLLAFTPGLIQASHFGTTESVLVFVFLASCFLALKIKERLTTKYSSSPNPKLPLLLSFSSLILAIGLGSKISAAFFFLPFLLAFLFSLKNWKKTILACLFFFLSTAFFTLLFSPYNLLEFKEFFSTTKYEIGVARGEPIVFYTRQFEKTTPVLFQFVHILPYSLGPFLFLFSFLGLLILVKKLVTRSSFSKADWLIILATSLAYFIYQSFLFAKWTRFITPVLPFFVLLSTIFLSRIYSSFRKEKGKLIFIFLLLLCLIPGWAFFQIYTVPDVRLTASNWLNQNLPKNAFVFSEGGNVSDIPVIPYPFSLENFDFYTLDHRSENLQNLIQYLAKSDYLLIPSRRIFANYQKDQFPNTKRYYQLLYSGKLGFTPIKKITSFPNLKIGPFTIFSLDDEMAEESWSVFDHPVIRVYKRTKAITEDDYQKLFSQIK